MKVLIACEYSGIVRDAFLNKGHDAISCDLLPTESPGPHYQGDVFDIINDGFDLMIAHPPCQFLTYAANGYWNLPGREPKRNKAIIFFMQLLFCDIPKICVENPVGYMNRILNFDKQVIQPYYFGEDKQKRTVLWLKNLKPLQHFETSDMFAEQTHIAKPAPVYTDKAGKPRNCTDAISGFTKDATKLRSKFFPGIAAAMAEQWGIV